MEDYTGVDGMMGSIGGAPEANATGTSAINASVVKCNAKYGRQQIKSGKNWRRSLENLYLALKNEDARLRETGIDVDKVFTTDDLVKGKMSDSLQQASPVVNCN